jgi:WD40 repeat protein
MATDITQTEPPIPAAVEIDLATAVGAAETIQSPEAAQPASAADSLPPRVDPGENVDEVLGEVSKIFGQTETKAGPVAQSTGDINEDLNDLIAAGTPSAKPAVPAEPSPEMKFGSAADLFRSSPIETPDTPPIPKDSAPPPATQPATAFDPQVTPSTRRPESVPARGAAVTKRIRGLFDRIPSRARVPLAVTAALLMGWFAGASITRSRTHESAPVVATEERSAEKVSEQTKELTAKAAALEEQLQQALSERAAAQRDRQDAVVQLKLLEAQAKSGKQSTQSEILKEQDARQKAEAKYRSAEEQIQLLALRTYDVQLARVRETWRRNPGLAMTLLNDVEHCPPKLRDFTWGYLRSRAQNDRATLTGHTGRVNSVAWSPNGKEIASCGQDGLVKFWDAGSGKETASLVAHGGGVTALAFSLQGELLATAGADGTVKLWDVASRKIVGTFFGHLGTVRAVAISPDATSLVSGGDDGTVRFWDVATRRATATRWGRPRSREMAVDDPLQVVHSVAYSPDGLLVASGSYGVIRLWEAENAAEKSMLSVSEGVVTALAFTPQGKTLAAGSDGAIYRWDVDSLVPRSTPIAVEGRVNALRYSADGRFLAAATDHAALLFRQPADRQREVPIRLAGHVGEVTGIAIALDGETVVTSGDDGTLRLWNPQSGAVDKIEPDSVIRTRRPIVALAYSADGKRFAAGGADSITLWNVGDSVETTTLKNRSGDISQIIFSPDGTRLVTAGKDWPILIWDLASQRVTAALNGHTGSVNSISFSADGKLVISGSDDGTVRVWDPVTARELTTLSGHAAAVLCAVISPDGKLAASAGADHSVKLWDLSQKRLLVTLAGHQAPVVAIAFSPDGRFLASAEGPSPNSALVSEGNHRPIRLWRLPKGEAACEFGTPGTSVQGLALSPDGKTLATSARDGVTLWDAETGESRETLRFADAGPLAPIVFSPNGLTLAAGGPSAIVLWTASKFAN